jgi:hypothetical protein
LLNLCSVKKLISKAKLLDNWFVSLNDIYNFTQPFTSFQINRFLNICCLLINCETKFLEYQCMRCKGSCNVVNINIVVLLILKNWSSLMSAALTMPLYCTAAVYVTWVNFHEQYGQERSRGSVITEASVIQAIQCFFGSSNSNSKCVLVGSNLPSGLNAPGPSVLMGSYRLPATRTLRHAGIEVLLLVTHCLLAAPHYFYPRGMEGWVNPPAPWTEPGLLHDR